MEGHVGPDSTHSCDLDMNVQELCRETTRETETRKVDNYYEVLGGWAAAALQKRTFCPLSLALALFPFSVKISGET